jgi:non-ribosomal peptide synthetase component F
METGVRVPIGQPVENYQLYLLDELLRPVPVGVEGELHIGGAGVSRGYLRRPELTAQKFIPILTARITDHVCTRRATSRDITPTA